LDHSEKSCLRRSEFRCPQRLKAPFRGARPPRAENGAPDKNPFSRECPGWTGWTMVPARKTGVLNSAHELSLRWGGVLPTRGWFEVTEFGSERGTKFHSCGKKVENYGNGLRTGITASAALRFASMVRKQPQRPKAFDRLGFFLRARVELVPFPVCSLKTGGRRALIRGNCVTKCQGCKVL